MLGAGFLLPLIWPDVSTPSWDRDEFIIYAALYGLLCTAGALHLIRYHFGHGHGRARYESDLARRVEEGLRHADLQEADEQEELIRVQMMDRLKSRRLVWQHLAIFTGIAFTFSIGHAANFREMWHLEWGLWRDVVVFFSIWGIGLAAHILRYVFAFRVSSRAEGSKD